MIKRSFDFIASAVGLVILSPILGLLGLLVKLSDGGPVFYRQERVGLRGRPCYIWKLRSMVKNAESRGPSITKSGDPRVTAVGRFMRKNKLDELPQLWNVLKGEMSFVGPRPEVARYVALYTKSQSRVLDLKPGITDLATIAFRNEEELLACANDADEFYREFCLPKKIELNLSYGTRANFWRDLKIIFLTLLPQLQAGSNHSKLVPSQKN